MPTSFILFSTLINCDFIDESIKLEPTLITNPPIRHGSSFICRITLVVVLLATLFNVVNVYIQGSWIFIFGSYEKDWLWSPFFIIGLSIFIVGLFINIKSDNILIKLREQHGEGYHIPEGFLYKKVSNPNYFGEILEWLGWFILTLSPAGLVFFIWTIANLIPRAKSNHEWCVENIKDYPCERKKIIPFIY